MAVGRYILDQINRVVAENPNGVPTEVWRKLWESAGFSPEQARFMHEEAHNRAAARGTPLDEGEIDDLAAVARQRVDSGSGSLAANVATNLNRARQMGGSKDAYIGAFENAGLDRPRAIAAYEMWADAVSSRGRMLDTGEIDGILR